MVVATVDKYLGVVFDGLCEHREGASLELLTLLLVELFL